MANGYTPGGVAPINMGTSYSDMLNEQLGKIRAERDQNIELRRQRNERFREAQAERVNTLVSFDTTGMNPAHAQAIEDYKQQMMASVQNMGKEGGYTSRAQFINEIATLSKYHAFARGYKTLGQQGEDSLMKTIGNQDELGRPYLTTVEAAEQRRSAWDQGLMSGLQVSGEIGSRTITGTPLGFSGEAMTGQEPVELTSNPLAIDYESYWKATTGDPVAWDQSVTESFAFGMEAITSVSQLEGDGGKALFMMNNEELIRSYKRQWIRERSESRNDVADALANWSDEKWEAEGVTEDIVYDAWKKAAEKGLSSRLKSAQSSLSQTEFVDGLPAFNEPVKLMITDSRRSGLSGDVVSIRPVGDAVLQTGANGEPIIVGDIELVYATEKVDGVSQNRVERVSASEEGVYQAVMRALAQRPMEDLMKIWEASGGSVDLSGLSTDSDAEKKNPAVTDAEGPVATTTTASTTTTAADGGPSTQSVTPSDQPVEEQPAEAEEEEDRQATLKSEYDELLKGARSARVLDFFGAGKPYSDLVRSIQSLPLSMQKRLIQDKLNEEASNMKRGSRPEVLKAMIDKLNQMGVEAETDEQVAEKYTSIQRELSDINAEIEVTPERVPGLNRDIANPAYINLVDRRNELMSIMDGYESVFGVMRPRPERMQEAEGNLPPSSIESPSQGLDAPKPTPSTTPSVETTLPPEVVEEPTKVTEKPGATLPYPNVDVPKEEEELKAAVKAGNAKRSPGRAGKVARRKAAKIVTNLAASLGHPFPEAVASQYAIETGWWPKTEINNLFGMKVGAKTSEQLRKLGIEFGTIVLPTYEEIEPQDEAGFLARNPGAEFVRKDGENSIFAIDANFYSFPDIETGVKGYIAWTQFNMPQAYSEEVKNGLEYVEALKKAGYATDSGYVPKLNSVVSGNLGIEGGLQSVQRRDY